MDIKIRARLSAYSRLESLEGLQNNIPSPSVEDAKKQVVEAVRVAMQGDINE